MRAFKVFLFLLGVFLLVWIIRKIGLEELLAGFQRLGWRLVIPILIIFPCYILYTFSWQFFLKRFDEHSIPFWALFKIKIAGEASNTLTPLNFAGGDPVRIWLLSKSFPMEVSGASVVVDRTLQILAIVALIFLGTLAALFKLDLPPYARNILGVTVGLLLFFVLLFVLHQTKGLFQKLLRLVSKLRIRTFSEKTVKKIEELDFHISEFYRRDRRLFLTCFLLHFSARLVGVAEIWFLGRFLGVPMGPWEALFFSAVIPVTNMIGGIVPGTLGVLEGVVSSLFLALHWDPANGVVLQIARRLRSLFYILLGMSFILLFKSKK